MSEHKSVPENPPAFACADSGMHQAMSLRDWFAGQALIGITAGRGQIYSSAKDAADAYKMADAMLAQREASQ